MTAYSELPYFIQGLVDPWVWGDPYQSWSSPGTAVQLRYQFAIAPVDGEQNLRLFTEAQQASVRLALSYWGDVSGVSFLEVASDAPAEVTLFRDDLTSVGAGDAAGYAWMPSYYDAQAGDVHINSIEYGDASGFGPGTYEFQVLLHEIGHALGLKHPFDEPALPAAEDTQTNTVMTYNLDWNNAESLGMFDLAAVHALYGVDHAARSGANIYHLSDRYIWDGAGVDMLDGSAETQRLNIKLSEGSWIWAGAQSTSILDAGQAFIGYGTLIERAKGGSAGDILQGNASNNLLFGNAGFDLMWGFAGNDTLFGGTGNDRLFGGTGNDALYGSGGHDSLVGGNGNDALTAGVGNDTLVGGLGWDTLSGGDGADVFRYFSRQEAGNGGGRDLILDFVSGEDVIQLTGIDANENTQGVTEAFSFVGSAAFSGQAGELRYVQGVGAAAGDGILMGDVNGDKVADFQIQLVGSPVLLESDLILSV